MKWEYEHCDCCSHINLVVLKFYKNNFLKYMNTEDYGVPENRKKYFIKLLGYGYFKQIAPLAFK